MQQPKPFVLDDLDWMVWKIERLYWSLLSSHLDSQTIPNQVYRRAIESHDNLAKGTNGAKLHQSPLPVIALASKDSSEIMCQVSW